MLITRVNGEVISPQQVEALCAYSYHLSCGPMQEATEAHQEEGEGKILAYKQLVDGITPAKFREFYGYYKSIKEMENPAWEFRLGNLVTMTSIMR